MLFHICQMCRGSVGQRRWNPKTPEKSVAADTKIDEPPDPIVTVDVIYVMSVTAHQL